MVAVQTNAERVTMLCSKWLNHHHLNDDIFRIILSFLSITELNRVHETSKSFRMARLTTEDAYWRNYVLTTLNELIKRAQYRIPTNTFTKMCKIDDFYIPYTNNTIQKDFKRCLIHLKRQMNEKVDNNMKNTTKKLSSLQRSEKSNKHEFPFINAPQLLNLTDNVINQYATRLNHSTPNKFKVTFNGEGSVGKSSLIYVLNHGVFPDYWMFRTDGATLNKTLFSTVNIEISLCDTIAQEEYEKLRVLSYPETDLFLLCFDVSNLDSFWKVYDYWIHEIRNFSTTIPTLLIACKTDLRRDTNTVQRLKEQHFLSPITHSMGEALAKTCHCLSYLETSSLDKCGLEDLITVLFRSVILKATHGFQKLFPQHSNRCMLQ